MMSGGTSLGELDWLLDNLVSSVLGPDGEDPGPGPGPGWSQ